MVAADPSPFPLLVPSLPSSPFPPRPHTATHTSLFVGQAVLKDSVL